MAIDRQILSLLLAEEPFVRALAESLAAGDGDDVAQQAWLQAMQSRPRGLLSPRAWLARIVRNLAADRRRRDVRRDHRLRAAAAGERVPSAAALVEIEETRRALVAAVNELSPPLRTVVLLRYYDGLPPRRIAGELGIGVDAVWNRLRSALRLLRERLDERHGGDRRAWLLPVGSLAAGPRALPWRELFPLAVPVGWGVMVMAKGKMVAAAAAVLVLLAVTWSVWPAAGPPAQTAHAGNATVAASEQHRVAAMELGTAEPAPLQREVVPGAADVATTGSLLVRVRWADGTAAAGEPLLVAFEDDDPPFGPRRVHTDAAGEVRLDGLPLGKTTVRRLQNQMVAGNAEIHAGELTELEFVLRAGVMVHGIVVDGSGHGIAGAELEIDQIGGERGSAGTTAADGTFTIRDMAPYCLVGARAPGFTASPLLMVKGAVGGTGELRLQLDTPGGAVAGLVSDALGKPIAGALVRVGDAEIYTWTMVGVPPPAPKVLTGADGRFLASGIALGRVPVTVRARGLPPWRGECSVSAGTTSEVDVQLTEGATCTGIVRSAEGVPLSGVWIETGDGVTFTHLRAVSTADGSFVLAGLPAGEVELRARQERHGKATVVLRTTAGVRTGCDLTLDPGITLRGMVIDERGSPVADVFLSAMGGDRQSGGSSGADGRFMITNCPDGLLKVSALAARADGRRVEIEGVDPGAGAVTLQLPPRRVRPAPTIRIGGRVLAPDGQPLAHATVTAFMRPPVGEAQERADVATGADGSFELGPLRPGSWCVGVSSERFPRFVSELHELATGGTWRIGDIRLLDGGTALISVQGAPAGREIRFRVRQVDGGNFAASWVGERTLCTSVLVPGVYELQLSCPQCVPRTLPFTVRAGEEAKLDAMLEPGIRQQLQFARADGSAVGNSLSVRVRSGDTDLDDALHFMPAARPGTRTAELWLLPGSYRLEASDAGAAVAATVSIGEAEAPPLQLILR